MRHVAVWIGWWLALFWLWLLLVGEWNRQEWVAAAAAATVAATVAEFARARTDFAAVLPWRALGDVPHVLLMVVVDFGIVVGALLASLARREVARGEFRSRRLSRPADAEGVGPRAWAALAASYSPNAYVLEIDPETRRVLLHDLVPHESSESPA